MAVFYVALDHASFVAANPEFSHLVCPSGPGLKLAPRCLSCGCPTEQTETFVSGARTGRNRQEFEQPVYLCGSCLGAREKTHSNQRVHRATRLAIAAVLATAMSIALRTVMGLSEIVSIAAWVLVVPVLYAMGSFVVRTRPVSPWQNVDILWFRDPRKGEGAEFLCIRIDNQQEALRFTTLNPNAIGQDQWDASYERPDAHLNSTIDRDNHLTNDEGA